MTDDELNRIPRLPKRAAPAEEPVDERYLPYPPVAIYRQEASEENGVMGATILEMLGGPKTYARIWDHTPLRVEYGWTLHESAVEVWRSGG